MSQERRKQMHRTAAGKVVLPYLLPGTRLKRIESNPKIVVNPRPIVERNIIFIIRQTNHMPTNQQWFSRTTSHLATLSLLPNPITTKSTLRTESSDLAMRNETTTMSSSLGTGDGRFLARTFSTCDVQHPLLSTMDERFSSALYCYTEPCAES